MKLLIIEPCTFTRLGIYAFLTADQNIAIHDFDSIENALSSIEEFKPDIAFVNVSQYCHIADVDPSLRELLELRHSCTIFCYMDSSYPESTAPILVSDNFFILNKHAVTPVLKDIIRSPASVFLEHQSTMPSSALTDQETLVMNYWMAEMPNYRIAKKLNISSRTVYVHKRHITQKMKVHNRLEFCFVYNLIKYLYWPINRKATLPLSRQTKSDILSLSIN